MKSRPHITRRQYMAAAGATALAAGFGLARPALAQGAVIRQGYQTNMWGMPTYYLLRSGLLEKRGLKFEEFAVPSGNLTMQQMVARQVDLGTYAGPSLILGHDKGGMAGIAVVEYVGRTCALVVRKDLNISKIEQLKGMKTANQVGASVGNIFVDQVLKGAGITKGDFQEVRMNVNDIVAALAAKTADAMTNIEPYNAIAESEGIGTSIVDLSNADRMPVFMAATPDFLEKNPDTAVNYLKGWLDVARDFKEQPAKVAGVIHEFFTSKGYKMSPETFKTALGRVDVNPGFPSDLDSYMRQQAEVLVREKRIGTIPDWKKVLRPEFMEKARAGA